MATTELDLKRLPDAILFSSMPPFTRLRRAKFNRSTAICRGKTRVAIPPFEENPGNSSSGDSSPK